MDIRATDSVSLSGESSQGFLSSIFSQVKSGAVGTAGGITLDAGRLSLETGAAINASTLGEGDAGAVVIRATDSVSLSGESSQGFVSGIFSTVTSGAVGSSGGIGLETVNLSLSVSIHKEGSKDG